MSASFTYSAHLREDEKKQKKTGTAVVIVA